MALDAFDSASLVELGVWPVYVGVTEQPSQRAQISYRHDGDQIVGSARLHVSAGTYTRLYYFHTPNGPASGGVVDIPPLVMPDDGIVDLDPITV
ncbi:hypothetical protein [Gordonia sp. SL306]|uniref:hypothetical protein n=1 Tax=Gordonia sp. SL306 TaxID=2995145 RepID=UPI00226FEDEA|nr:hypothetical protein [Gordonia sp. SL306]WAC54965.1 hypothetical protein OVA31_20360 [Gordonia sp. SL306]